MKKGGGDMEKDRGTRVIAIVALLVGVVGLSIGFAAFSSQLNISSSAEVTPDSSKFNVDFTSTSSGNVSTAAITPTKSPTTLVATDGAIDNSSDPTVTGLHATFTEPGQSVTYSFWAKNIGEYIAYLNSITIANATSADSYKKCTAKSGTTQALVDAACNGISMTVKVGNETATSSSVASISDHSLAVDGYDPVIVTINYAANSGQADGDFEVAFGDITLTYSSVD